MAESIAEAMEQATETLDRRSVMEKAFDSLETGAAPTRNEAETHEEPVVKTRTEEREEPVVKPIKDELPESKRIPSKTTPPKDADGKFVKGAKSQKDPVFDGPAKENEVKPVEEQPQGKTAKAPVSWKPDARAEWGKLSPRVQTEILKRETEVTQALNLSATARKFGQEFYNIIKPYEALIRGSGVTPMQAVNNLVQTAGSLMTGSKAQRAAIVAQLIATYDVDIPTLDATLAGKAVPKEKGNSDEVLRLVEERMKPVNEFISTVQGRQQASQQELMQDVARETNEFAEDPANEFFEDLRDEIADLLEVAARRGRKMTIKEAYDRACQSDPDVSKVLAQRSEAARTAERAKNYDKSRRATVSTTPGIPGGVGKAGGGAPVGRRAAIEQALEDLSSR
jgi:hypothetical protein